MQSDVQRHLQQKIPMYLNSIEKVNMVESIYPGYLIYN